MKHNVFKPVPILLAVFKKYNFLIKAHITPGLGHLTKA